MAVSIAPTPPAVCAGCFNSKNGKRFVDLGAAYDGPTFVDAAGGRQSVDDNIVCEDCIREAARALDLAEHPVRETELRAERAERDVADWRRYAEGLEQLLAHRPEPKKRPPGRPPVKPGKGRRRDRRASSEPASVAAA